MNRDSRKLIWVGRLTVIAVALFAFIYHFLHWDVGFNADTAMIGLMSKRILDVGEYPIFVWTVGYQGIILDTYLGALIMALFGVSAQNATLPALIYSLILLAVLYAVIKRLISEPVAILTCLLLVVSSPQFYAQFLQTLPNYPQANFGGLIGVLLFLLLAERWPKTGIWLRQSTAPKVCLLGVVHGFFYYTFVLSAFYALSIFAFLALVIVGSLDPHRPWSAFLLPYKNFRAPLARILAAILTVVSWLFLLFAALSFFGFTHVERGAFSKPIPVMAYSLVIIGILNVIGPIAARWSDSLRVVVVYVLGFLVGYFPALYFVLVQGNQLGRSAALGGRWDDVLQRGAIFLQFHRRLLNIRDGDYLSYVSGCLVILCATFITAVLARRCWQTLRFGLVDVRAQVAGLLLFVPLAAITAFHASKHTSDIEHGRWLAPLIIYYALAVAFAVVALLNRFSGLAMRMVCVLLLTIVLTNNGLSIKRYFDGAWYFYDHFTKIIDVFDRYELTTGYGDYWLCYPVNLMTAERLILVPHYSNYAPHYPQVVQSADRIGLIDHVGRVKGEVGEVVKVGGLAYRVDARETVDNTFDFAVLKKI